MRYSLFFALLLSGAHIYSQAGASVTFVLPNVGSDNNTEVCLPVTVLDFTSGVDFSFTLLTDPNGALFSPRIDNITGELPNFDDSNFDLDTYAAEGLIVVEWQSYTGACTEASRRNLDDGTVLFEVCYQVSGGVATKHDVAFFDKPADGLPGDGTEVPIEFRKECTDISAFPGTVDGSVTIGVQPVVLDIVDNLIDDPDNNSFYQPGDTYCVDVVATSGFENIQAYQYGINYDPTVLRAISADANDALEGNLNSNYNLGDGSSVFAVFSPLGDQTYTLPDDTRLVTLCFEIIGDCAERTDVSIGPQQRGESAAPVEFNGPTGGLEIVPGVVGETRIIIDNCNSRGFDVVVDCPAEPVEYQSSICVDVNAGDDFDRMTDIDYTVSWDPAILSFTGIQNPATPTLDINDFDTDQIGNGRLFLEWSTSNPNALTLAEGETMYELCFDVIGFGGNSPILITNAGNNIESLSDMRFAGVNPDNCSVSVQQPDGVAVRFPSSNGFRETEPKCFSLTTEGFMGVNFIQFFITSPTKLEFVSATSGVAGLSITDFGGGGVQVSYDGADFTLPDGAALAELCYQAAAGAEPDNLGTCGEFDLLPFGATVQTTESEGSNVDIEVFSGDGCVLFPDGYGLIVSDATGLIDSNLCIPVSVTEFASVIETNARFIFDGFQLTYDRVELTGAWTGLTAGDFDLSRIDQGIIDLSWAGGGAGGETIGVGGDTIEVFQLCFDTGLEEACQSLQSALLPETEPVTLAGDAPGSIIFTDGEICTEDRLLLNSITVTDASCTGNSDGTLVFDVATRPNNEDIFVRVDNPVRFMRTDRPVDNLLPGQVNYIIYNESGTLRLEGTTTIGVNTGNAAAADAGEDSSLSCTENALANITGRNNVGETWQLFLDLGDGQSREVEEGTVSNDGNVFAQVGTPGIYYLTVTSEAGCTATDTVEVGSVGLPVAVVSEDLSIDCNGGGSVLISGAGSSDEASANTAVTYEWERLDGQGNPIETIGTDRDLTVTDPGRYQLTVAFPTLGCSNEAVASVRNELEVPRSSLPDQMTLNCDGTPLLLSVGPEEADVTYSWFRVGNSTLLSGGNTFPTEEAGTFEVELTNTVSGCSQRDTIVVVPNLGVPLITAPTETTLNCTDTTQLMVTYDNVNEDTEYRWSSTDGGAVLVTESTDPSPRILRTGTYKVVVSNGGCVDSATLVVTDPLLPTVDAGPDAEIDCESEMTLTGTATSPDGGEIAYQWSRQGIPLPAGAAVSVVVDQPGTYLLTATSVATGCEATDSVTLMAPMGFPVFTLADTIGGLGCAPSTVTLTVDVELGADYSFQWTDPNGIEISTADTAETNVEGLHTLTVTNNATNCSGSEQVLVVADAADPPFVTFARNNLLITCESGGGLIDASSSDQGPSMVYTWSSSQGGEEPSTQGNDSLRVQTPGTYTLTIRDTVTNCEASRSIEVTQDVDLPDVTGSPEMPLDCDARATTLSIQINDQPNNYDIQWFGPAGVDGLPRDTTSINVTQAGTYNAVVINPTTSCVETVIFRVPDLVDSIATIGFLPVDSFDCSASTVTIDASPTETGGNGNTISWTSLDSNTVTPPTGSLIVAVDGAGDYVLAISDGSGCTVRDTVTVEASEGTPFADAGDRIEINCGDQPLLDGTGSTPPNGDLILYEWIVIEGNGIVVSGGDTQTPIVSGPGIYQLAVTNSENLCSDFATVEVVIADQAAARIDPNINFCQPTFEVTANLPPGTSGIWSSFNDAGATYTVEENVATVTDLANGLTLVYSLSAPGCGEYSSDTLEILPAMAPIANDDVLQVSGLNNTGSVNVLANDVRTGRVRVELINQPAFGDIVVNLNGDITFTAPIGLTATTQVRYSVCIDSPGCEDLCSEANIEIISDGADVPEEVFNAITPNGDGMNDQFVFRRLQLSAPDEFTDNELIIFNRWGDIIYEAQPYNNDWMGVSTTGEPVPEGTYYYIMRFDIGEGDIIRGDVTVIR